LICPNCSTENVAGAKFCMECGQTFAAGCPNCGFVNLPNAKFCSECGTGLAARGTAGATPAARPTAAVGAQPVPGASAERRLVSILFADLVGFTPFAEERDSEDVRDTLTRYFDIATEVIGRYGGTIEKFIGDAVMAVWGAPTAHEDDAERAVRAALDLVDAVGVLGKGIQARAGVLTGEAAVTVGATNQGLVAGDLVNTASRLQSVAPPGAVLVGDSTQRAASAAIAFEKAGDQMLKGKQAPVAAWRALRVVAERGGRNRAETLEAPFVGRAEETRLLKDLFHATGREKRVRVVSVIGPAGIGKSRLTREFSKYIDGLVEPVYWHSGRSPAYGEGITFWALGEMVRERCGLRELDDEATTRAKVTEKVAEFVPDASEREWIERALLTLLGVEGGVGADQLFGAWRTFFERIAEQGTVVLAFEDMHFADTGLLDFVDHLLEWSRGLPLYVVTLARPDLIERRQSWGAGKRNFVSLYLEPLPETAMRELLAGLVPGLPVATVASIVARADGIPLYAVETIRTLLADGRLVEEGGFYVPKGDLTTLAVPETLTALIASRLDALEETDRRLVHDAAVLGQSFSIVALAAVADIAPADLEPRLAALVRRELLQREMDARSPERGQYTFVQALIREVAYNTLSKRDRKKLHLAAARHFESLANDEIAGALASHYLAAHANAGDGPDADALAGQARIALKAAAGRAAALGAQEEATAFYEQALAVAADEAEQVDLLGKAALAARIAGRLARAEELLRRAEALARQVGDRAQIAYVTGQLGNVLGVQFRPSEAVELLEPAVAEYTDLDDGIVAELKMYLARALVSSSDPRRALALLEDVLETAERRAMVPLIASAAIAKGNALLQIGRRRESIAVTMMARDLATEHGLTDVAMRALGNVIVARAELDLRAGLDSLRDAIAVASKRGQRASVLNSVGNFGYQGFVAGEWDEALKLMTPYLEEDIAARDRLVIMGNLLVIRASRGEDVTDALAELKRLGQQMSGTWQLFVADPEANAALAAGDLVRAREVYTEIANDDLGQAPEYVYRAVRAALWQGDLDNARALLRRFDETGADGPVVDARRATMKAGIAAAEGRSSEALPLYGEALDRWRTVHGRWDEALTGVDMVSLLNPAEPEVAAVIAPTRAILERLQARPFLERLDAAVARVAGRPLPATRPATRAEVAVTD
jgi:class 3 adenylate cyclase/tetratricopeptide (TPR) repeat protein